MILNFAEIKRKHKREIFNYFLSKYGIEKATNLLNDFFEKRWQDIPGQDILDILVLLDNAGNMNENEEIVEQLNTSIKNLQHTVNDLKVLRKMYREG